MMNLQRQPVTAILRDDSFTIHVTNDGWGGEGRREGIGEGEKKERSQS